MKLDLNTYYPTCNLPRLFRTWNHEGDAEYGCAAAVIALVACQSAHARNPDATWIRPTLLGAALHAGNGGGRSDFLKRSNEVGQLTGN